MNVDNGRGIGKAMDGMVSLAKVGMAAIVVLFVAVPIGVIALVWWLVRHVRIQ